MLGYEPKLRTPASLSSISSQPSRTSWTITQADKKKKNLSVLEWRLYFSIVFFPAESESGVKSRGLTAYIEHNLKKLSKNHILLFFEYS